MLKILRIQNFKGWRDTDSIRLAPITLFFGANSSGKSSIGQFLMMLKQTVESPDRKAVFYPGSTNSAVQLGSYQEMVYNRNPETKITFNYQWSLPKPLEIKTFIKDSITGKNFSGDNISFQATVGLLKDKNQHTLSLDQLQYELMEKNETSLSIGMERQKDSTYTVRDCKDQLRRKQGRAWPPGTPVRFYGFPDEVVAYYQNADFVQTLNLMHEKFFRSLCYLGPLRSKPDRLYAWTGNEPASVGYAGENTVAAILAASNRKISLGYNLPAKPFAEIIAQKLKEMGLIEEFKVNRISEQRQEYEVKVRTKGAMDWVDLPDVGFGVSQVLPVLVQCFYAPAGSIIIMEQPEIHLHPKAQSVLADIMIEVIKSRENKKNRDIQLIIETHSEHFLRRLQRRIAEDKETDSDKILKEKIAVYFANITKRPATLEPLQIDRFGNIQNWPENFFGDEMGDIIEQAKAATKKQMQKDIKPEVPE